MKKMITTLVIGSLLATGSIIAYAEDLSKERTIDMCLEYHYADKDRKTALYKEIDRRGMVSHKDLEGFKSGNVYAGSSVCGMYMISGNPIEEKARQLRFMTYKVVHVYPTQYYVSQSGIVMEVLERKEGKMPPSLIKERPAVEPPPVLYDR